MTSYLTRYRRRRFIFWGVFLLLFAGLVALNFYWLGPGPPRHISMATGVPKGAYAFFGERYQERLDEMGMTVNLVSSNGSIDNLKRLQRGEVDVAFVQAGTPRLLENPSKELRGIAAVFLEPVWIFYRHDLEIDIVTNLVGKTIAIGPQESGTAAIAGVLLHENGIDEQNANVKNATFSEAAAGLKSGDVDVGVFVSSEQSAIIQDLLREPKLRLLDFRRAQAYSRKLPYLRVLHLGEGIFDLNGNIPDGDIRLVAPSVLLCCRESLHPRVVEQILVAAEDIQSPGSLIDPPGQFPTLEGVDLPVHVAAKSYMQTGQSWLSQLLPYAVLRWVLRLQILILPLIGLWIPFVKIFPAIYQYRINTLLKLHYSALRDVENDLDDAQTPEELEQHMGVLDNLREDMERISRKVPAHMQRDVYNWRLHISLVRSEAEKRLQELQQSAAKPAETA